MQWTQVRCAKSGNLAHKPPALALAVVFTFVLAGLVRGREPQLVKDMNTGPESSYPARLTTVGDRIFFRADQSRTLNGLWVSDGTEDGTLFVKEIRRTVASIGYSWSIAPVGHRVFFTSSRLGRELWVTDGTQGGTRLVVADIGYIQDLRAVGNRVFFRRVQGGSAPQALWVSDGTRDGTLMLMVNAVANLGAITVVGDRVFFFRFSLGADGEHRDELWVSDGTHDGTRLVRDIVRGMGGTPSRPLAAVGGRLFFWATGALWVTDGTEEGTLFVKKIEQGSPGVCLSFAVWCRTTNAVIDERVFFVVVNPDHGVELWVSDGTEDGTRLVRDIIPGMDGSRPDNLVALGDRVFFAATDLGHGEELWMSDGTEDGTRLVGDIIPGVDGSRPDNLAAAGDRLFFTATDTDHGEELWILPLERLEIYDDFEDGDYADGCPAMWETTPVFPGSFDLVNGDLVSRGAEGFLQTQRTFSGDVSVRAQGTFRDLNRGQTAIIYVGAHVDDTRVSGYLGALTSDGQAKQEMFRDGQLVWSQVTPGPLPGFRSSEDDYVLQLDVIGSRIEMRIWRPQECRPEDPIFPPREDGSLRSGPIGVGFVDKGVIRYVWSREGRATILSECDLPGSLLPPCLSPPAFLRGDCNDDGSVDISDAGCILNWLFLGKAEISCVAAANTDGVGRVNITDPIYLLTHLFLGGPAPVMPFPKCGPGTLPTDEQICETPPRSCQQ